MNKRPNNVIISDIPPTLFVQICIFRNINTPTSPNRAGILFLKETILKKPNNTRYFSYTFHSYDKNILSRLCSLHNFSYVKSVWIVNSLSPRQWVFGSHQMLSDTISNTIHARAVLYNSHIQWSFSNVLCLCLCLSDVILYFENNLPGL